MTPAVAEFGRFAVKDVSIWDTSDIFALYSDEQTVRYMGVRRLETMTDAAELISRLVLSETRWLSILSGTKFLGVVGLEIQRHQATLSIALNRSREARGAGRQFARPFVQWIFTHPQIWRVWSFVHVDNIPGQNVTERCGALREGCLRRFEVFPNLGPEPQDVYVYAITR